MGKALCKEHFWPQSLGLLDNLCVISNEIQEYSANVPILVKYHRGTANTPINAISNANRSVFTFRLKLTCLLAATQPRIGP